MNRPLIQILEAAIDLATDPGTRHLLLAAKNHESEMQERVGAPCGCDPYPCADADDKCWQAGENGGKG